MKQFITAVTLSLYCSIFCSMVWAHEAEPMQDHISVVGVGEVEEEPDQATLNISINAQEPTLLEAKKLADERYSKVLKVISDAGIDDKFVKATRVSAQPQYEWRLNKRVYTGEAVSRTLSITINDLDKVSPLMQALVENDVSTIDGLTTGFQDRKALQEKALAAAADDAKSKAAFLAERLGRNLGAAYLITEHNANEPQVYRAELSRVSKSFSTAEAPPEMFGTQKVSASIKVSFNLL